MKKLLNTSSIKMKNIIIIIAILCSISSAAQQKGMALVTDYTGHQINAPDSLSVATVKEYITSMEDSNVNYEPRLRKIKAIKIIGRDRTFVADSKNGVIRLNYRLNDFPYTKRVAILQQLGINQGLELVRGNGASILMNFNVSDANEEKFKRQKSYRSTITKLQNQLEK